MDEGGFVKILITGASGFLGQHVVEEAMNNNLQILTPSSTELNLLDINSVLYYFNNNDFDTILHLAAFVGGIGLNKRQPADLTHKNLLMAVNLYTAIKDHSKIKNVYNCGSACGYPENCPLPFKEEDFWNGREELTNSGYSFAKKALLVLGEKYRNQCGLNSVFFLPSNIFGPKDHFELQNSHVIPAIVKKVCDAYYLNKDSVNIWGTGNATRDFIFVKDVSRGLVLALTQNLNTNLIINLGTGVETSIREVVNVICDIVGYTGSVVYDHANPDGQPRRYLDVSRAKEILGFQAQTSLLDGLKETVKWYQTNIWKEKQF
jgi:GDP-L-fucose synthase